MNDQVLITTPSSMAAVGMDAMPVESLLSQMNQIQSLMKAAMRIDEHYGIIPGCGNKPSLLKPGAEKISFMFRLAPEYQINKTDLLGGHREYEIVCTLRHVNSGLVHGQGIGAASTMEAKYRYRTGPKQSTGNPVPKEYWDTRKSDPIRAQELLGGKGFTIAKSDSGVWEICIQGEKVEHDNPADYYNTVLKMAKKRAHVDAVLTATAASDIFTQDIEDTHDAGANGHHEKPPIKTPQKTTPAATEPPRQEHHHEEGDLPPETAPPPAHHAPQSGERIISEPQRKRLFAIWKGAGWTEAEVKDFILAEYNIANTTGIPTSKYAEICDFIAQHAKASQS